MSGNWQSKWSLTLKVKPENWLTILSFLPISIGNVAGLLMTGKKWHAAFADSTKSCTCPARWSLWCYIDGGWCLWSAVSLSARCVCWTAGCCEWYFSLMFARAKNRQGFCLWLPEPDYDLHAKGFVLLDYWLQVSHSSWRCRCTIEIFRVQRSTHSSPG